MAFQELLNDYMCIFNPYYSLCSRLQCITQIFLILCFSICFAIVLHCHGVTSRSGLLSHDPGQFPANWNLGSIKLMNSFLIEPSYLVYDFILLQARNEVEQALFSLEKSMQSKSILLRSARSNICSRAYLKLRVVSALLEFAGQSTGGPKKRHREANPLVQYQFRNFPTFAVLRLPVLLLLEKLWSSSFYTNN